MEDIMRLSEAINVRLNEMINPYKGYRPETYYTAGDIPSDVIKAFKDVANTQRYKGAEYTMQNITVNRSLVWYGSTLEHIGDLIHAFTDAVEDRTLLRDAEYRIGRCITYLSNLRPNLQELEYGIDLDLRSNHSDGDKQTYMRNLSRELDKYVEAHYRIPAYNELHELCKQATTSLGSMEYQDCYRALKKIEGWFNDGSILDRMYTVHRDNQENLVRFS